MKMVTLRKSKSPLDRSKRRMNFLTSPELQTQDAIITVTCSHRLELWNGSIQTHYGLGLNFDFCHIRIKQSHSVSLLNSFAIWWRHFDEFNSQAPDVPELAHQGTFQLSRLSVNCYVKTMKKYPLHLNLTDFLKILSVPHDHCGSHNYFIIFFRKIVLFMVFTYF